MSTRAACLVLVLLSLVPAVACSGGGSVSGAIPGVAEARAQRDEVDGAPQLTSTVSVRFDRTPTFAPRHVPFASLFELAIPGVAGGPDQRVLVREAEQAQDNPRLVALSVDVVVPQGTTLKIARKAFQEGAEGDIAVEVKSDISPAAAILASTSLEITSAGLIDKGTSPPVTADDRDPAAMRLALDRHLQARGSSAEVRAAALARYDTMPTSIVSSPKARAALAALTGTFAEPAIDALVTDKNCTGKPAALVAFQPPPEAPELFARVTFTKDGSRVVSLSPAIEGEPIERLMPILAHEAIHCDAKAGRFEEIAATAFDTFLFLQIVAAEPDLARGGSPLARDLNVDAVALINSGRKVPESVGVLQSPGVRQALPGTTSPVTSFAELVANAYGGLDTNESPEEPLAQRYAATLAGIAGMEPGAVFDLQYLDELLGRAMDGRVLLAAIGALGLAAP